jgi:hypothetical protein
MIRLVHAAARAGLSAADTAWLTGLPFDRLRRALRRPPDLIDAIAEASAADPRRCATDILAMLAPDWPGLRYETVYSVRRVLGIRMGPGAKGRPRGRAW